MREIVSPCCCFSADGSTEEVHVYLSDCPIKRELGQRTVKDRNSITKSNRDEVNGNPAM